ncbi:MAG: hypothetical protein AAGA65_15760 [Actinomycetota bacterium]
MLVPFIIVLVVAVGLAVLWILAERKAAGVGESLADTSRRLEVTETDLASAKETITGLETDVAETTTERDYLASQLDENAQLLSNTADSLTEANESLRKRTELADAQAMQIDTLSAARDELQQRLTVAEERIVTLASRPGVVVGELSTEDSNAEMLWDLEIARSERAWRNSVAINPVDDPSPFESTEDPVRTAVEIEASALREDVGAMITVDWSAGVIESPSRRLIVVRVAQEMLALASRAPGAAKLIVAEHGDDGELTLEFETMDDSNQVINLIPPRISSDLIDIRNDSGLSVTVRAEPRSA